MIPTSRSALETPPTASGADPSKLLNSAWSELADGRWQEARLVFEAALRIQETAEACEGLSWAAWWLDDAAGVLDARERAFELYRKAGDPASAARMATWLAADQLDFHGAASVANGWLQRARRLLAPLEPRADHGWLAFHEGYIALLNGELHRSAELGARAAEIGRKHDVADLEMLGLALHGAALVERADVDTGMACLDEAAALALASNATIPISRAWACCFLVGACEAVRDYARAFEWCDRIAEFAARYGSRYMLGFCRAHYGAVHVWRGHWDDAQRELEAAVDAYAVSRPAFVSSVRAELAELRRKQGQWDEADRLLAELSPGSALLCRARLALDRGDVGTAIDYAERLLRRQATRCELRRAPALELLVRARTARGELDHATEALEELKEIARVVANVPMLAAAGAAEGTVAAAAAGADHEHARHLLEEAAEAYARLGAPFEEAEVRLELARIFMTSGMLDEARREAAHGKELLTELGATVLARRATELLRNVAEGCEDDAPLRDITRREREVLRWVAEGYTNRQIAEQLFVSEHTVHRHVTNILRKLQLPSRAAAAAHAVRSGLLHAE